MAAPDPATTTVGALSLGGILAANALGVSIQTVALGVCFAGVAMLGRFVFDLQKAIEAGEAIKLTRALGYLSLGFLGAPFIAIMASVTLKQIGVLTDTSYVIIVSFLGFTGPKGLSWLLNLLTPILKGIVKLPVGSQPPPPPTTGNPQAGP